MDGSPLDKGMPNYLVEPIEYGAESVHIDQIQLVDFGECKCSPRLSGPVMQTICSFLFREPSAIARYAIVLASSGTSVSSPFE
jgi:hypothetical protein